MQKISKLLAAKQFAFLGRLRKKFPAAEVFLVGGIVRDALLHRPSKDYDFVVGNVALPKLRQFLASQGHVDLVGKNFGVLKFIPRGFKGSEAIDVALPRTEHSMNTGGYRDFRVQSDPHLPIEADLARRDFTINALAYDVQKKNIIDQFGGQADLAKKIIRTVGKPSERFTEDYSRILRGLRFACQLGFTIEPVTWSSIKKFAVKLNEQRDGGFVVPRETISRELVKSFTANPALALDLYDHAGAVKILAPELLKMKGCPQPKNFHSEGDVWIHTRLCLHNLRSRQFQKKYGAELSAELVLATLFHDLGKPYTIEHADRLRFNNHDNVGADKARAIMDQLKISSAGVDTGAVVWLISRHMLATHTKRSPMKQVTLEKYFFSDRLPGRQLLALMYADIMSTVPQGGQPDFGDFRSLERQVSALQRKTKHRATLPAALLDGTDIMKTLKLPPGPSVGQLKEAVREAQLAGKLKTKAAALTLIKNLNRHG